MLKTIGIILASALFCGTAIADKTATRPLLGVVAHKLRHKVTGLVRASRQPIAEAQRRGLRLPNIQRLLKDSGRDSVRINRLLTVRTHDVELTATLRRSPRLLRSIDRYAELRVGTKQWTRAKTLVSRLDDLVDRVANRIGLPPEGVHPTYADAAKPLVMAANGVSPAEFGGDARASDRALAAQLKRAPFAALPLMMNYLAESHVTPKLAPQTFRILSKRGALMTPQRRQRLRRLTDGLATAKSAIERMRLDQALAHFVRKAPTHEVLQIASHLSARKIVSRSAGFFHLAPGGSDIAPRACKALHKRHYRNETLGKHLARERGYLKLRSAAFRETKKVTLALGLGPRQTALVKWAIRLQSTFADREFDDNARGVDKPREKRTPREVFADHLAMRRAGRLDLDLARNYASDVMLTSNHGTFFGKRGMQTSAAILAKRVPTRNWVMERLFFVGNVVFETWSADVNGKRVTGFDAFLIKNGKIATQTVYYGDGSLSSKYNGLQAFAAELQ